MPEFQEETAVIDRAGYMSRPWETAAALFFPCFLGRPGRCSRIKCPPLVPRYGVDLTTGSGGYWIPSNASQSPRRHIAPSYTIWWFVIALYGASAVLHFSYSIAVQLCPITTMTGSEGFLCAFSHFNATMVMAVVVVALFALFMIRWGAVLTTPASQLHSPELLVPLLAQKIHGSPSSTVSLKAFRTRFVVPNRQRNENSNCNVIATNMSAFLKKAGCLSGVADFPTKGTEFFSDTLEGQQKANHLRTLYVLFLETNDDLEAWLDFNNRLSLLSREEREQRDLTKRTVIVTSQRFLRVHSGVLFKWLCLEFAEVGRDAELSLSGTPSDLGLAGAILGALSMKLADLLLEDRVSA